MTEGSYSTHDHNWSMNLCKPQTSPTQEHGEVQAVHFSVESNAFSKKGKKKQLSHFFIRLYFSE
jgi:hypothetical protein